MKRHLILVLLVGFVVAMGSLARAVDNAEKGSAKKDCAKAGCSDVAEAGCSKGSGCGATLAVAKTSGGSCCGRAPSAPKIAATLVSEKKEPAKKAPKLLCPVMAKPVKKDGASAKYKGGMVVFCCGGCKGKFAKETAKYATKANYQLVASGQAKQTGCPISGEKCKPEAVSMVGGVKVGYCCGGCQSKVTKAKPDAGFELVFNDKAFAKGFALKKGKEAKKK